MTSLANILTMPMGVRPVGREYVHDACRTRTIMSSPRVTQRMWCCHCREHFPLAEFRWVDGTKPELPA
jgi:hypothetical protein